MKSIERLNQSIYEQLEKETGIDRRICAEIMKQEFRLVKKEIEDDNSWGAITLFFFGSFTVQKRKQLEVQDMPLTKITK